MRLFLILLFTINKFQVLGQSQAENLSNKAFEFYIHSENIDSAIFYYKLLQNQFPYYRPGYTFYQIGSCFLEKGDAEKAKSLFLHSMALSDTLDSYPEGATLKIANIFFEEHNFQQALNYYDSSTSIYRNRNKYASTHQFSREGNYLTVYRKALCFEKLNQTDTAIRILTPRMFKRKEDVHIDSKEYKNMLDFYLILLRKKYTKKEIKNEFKIAMRQLTYKRENDTTFYKNNQEWKSIFIDCYFYFFDKKVIVYSGGIGVKNFSEGIPKFYKKEYLLKELSESSTYKKLSAL